VSAAPEGDVYAAGERGALLHFDGNAWNPTVVATDVTLRGLAGTGSDDVVAVGDAGTILHHDATGWWPVRSGTTANLYGVAVTPTLVALAGENDQIVTFPRSGATLP
jgi:hypothetical protein